MLYAGILEIPEPEIHILGNHRRALKRGRGKTHNHKINLLTYQFSQEFDFLITEYEFFGHGVKPS